jgi:hypothetical protein
MMFARTDTLAPLHRPQLLLLSTGEGLDASAEKACVDADEDGFDVLVVPWRSLIWQLDGATATAGLAFTAGAAPRPLTRPTRLLPELIAAIDWLEPHGLWVATRLGLLYPDAVLGCSADRPAIGDDEPPLAGLVTLAPFAAQALGDNEGDATRLRLIGEALSRVPSGSDRSALADPSRLVLAVNGAVFGFRGGSGAPVDADLFAAWRAVARERIAPPPPILLPMPGALAPGLLRSRLDKAEGTPDPLPPHPLAALLPCLAEGPVQVATKAHEKAYFAHLAPELDGPAIAGHPTGDAGLLHWLGRTIDPAADPATHDPLGMRLVEPGVGRSVLVDRLTLRSRPELVDFSALGAGVTPYASGGYANVGRLIDGMAGRDRGLHRRDCAARLEAAGCRAGQVVAVIGLPGCVIRVPHAPEIEAAVVVRGFRCMLRVKQLDPVGHFLHSQQYTPAAHALMLHPFWDAPGARRAADPLVAWQEQQTLAGLEAYAQTAALGQLAVHALMPPPDAGLGEARARRLALVRLYAPVLLGLARARLAVELGRDPESERLDNRFYAAWFADCLGKQLATFRRLRFLHDYHHPGVARTTEGTLHSLSENNVSLLAEFADLETAIFVERFDQAQVDTLFLTRADYEVLEDNYAAFHAVEVARARSVVLTLAFVALDGDPAGIAAALQGFDAAYAHGLEATA